MTIKRYSLKFSVRDWRIIRHAISAYLNAMEVQREISDTVPECATYMIDRLRYVHERLSRMDGYPRNRQAA